METPHVSHGGPAALASLTAIADGRREFASARERDAYAIGVVLALVPVEVREAFERVCRMGGK